MADSKLKVTFLDDGSIKVDARGVSGSDVEILSKLRALAEAVGGELIVEGHAPGVKHHHHGDGKVHSHG